MVQYFTILVHFFLIWPDKRGDLLIEMTTWAGVAIISVSTSDFSLIQQMKDINKDKE